VTIENFTTSDLSLITTVTTLVRERPVFSDIYALQGSVETCIRYTGIFNKQFIENLTENLSAKNFLQSIKFFFEITAMSLVSPCLG